MLMKPILHPLRHFWRFWLQPFFPWRASLGALRNYPRYLADWRQYERQQPGHPLNFADSQPCLFDATAKTPFDAHYFYQANWAMRNITHNPVALHIDVGSEVNFVGLLSTQIPVGFVDIRPLSAHLPGLFCLAGGYSASAFCHEQPPFALLFACGGTYWPGALRRPAQPARDARSLPRIAARAGRQRQSVFLDSGWQTARLFQCSSHSFA